MSTAQVLPKKQLQRSDGWIYLISAESKPEVTVRDDLKKLKQYNEFAAHLNVLSKVNLFGTWKEHFSTLDEALAERREAYTQYDQDRNAPSPWVNSLPVQESTLMLHMQEKSRLKHIAKALQQHSSCWPHIDQLVPSADPDQDDQLNRAFQSLIKDVQKGDKAKQQLLGNVLVSTSGIKDS